MQKILDKNIISIIAAFISAFALGVSMLTFIFSVRSAKSNSFSQKGSYTIFFRKRFLRGKKACFIMNVTNSAHSDVIFSNFVVQISPRFGGIQHATLFDNLRTKNAIGISKITTGFRRIKRRKFVRKYAYQIPFYLSSFPITPYFTKSWSLRIDKKISERLSRYCQYIEITDFLGNSEVWYCSFSLYLTGSEKPGWGWTKYRGEKSFKYYKFADFTVISPKDLIENHDIILQHEEIDLFKLEFDDNDQGYFDLENKLGIYEMKKYFQFINETKELFNFQDCESQL